MSLEDLLRGAFRSRVARVEASPAAWEGIQRRLHPRGLHPRRVAIALGFALLVSGGSFLALRSVFPTATRDRANDVAGKPNARVRVSASTRLPQPADALVVDPTGAWAVLPPRHTADRIDLGVVHVSADGIIDRTLTLDRSVGSLSLTAGGGELWGVVATGIDPNVERSLVRIDPSTGDGSIVAPSIGAPIAWGYGAIWGVADDGKGRSIVRVDPATGAVSPESTLSAPVSWITTAGSGVVWITSAEERVAIAVDEATDQIVTRIDVPAPGSIGRPVAEGSSLWIPLCCVNGSDGQLVRLDPSSSEPSAPIAIGPAGPVGVGAGRLWLIGGDGILRGLDPSTGQIDARVDVGAPGGEGFLTAAVQGDQAVWVATLDRDLVRVDISGT